MSRELDLRVAAALGEHGPPEDGTYWEPNGDGTWTGEHPFRYENGGYTRSVTIREWPPFYSKNLADAEVVLAWCVRRWPSGGKLAKYHEPFLLGYGDGEYYCWLDVVWPDWETPDGQYHGCGSTLAEAICYALDKVEVETS